VGDVVGKGIAAALTMASVQALARAIAPRENDPAQLNEILSASLSRADRPGRLVTFASLILEPESGDLRYSLAGHHPPLIVGPSGVRRLSRGGLPLGTGLDLPYEAGVDRIGPGEMLLVFTDGLVEAPAADDPDEEFGARRIESLLGRMTERRADETLQALLDAYLDHVGDADAADDMTIVIVRRR
jgi:serine phosphatase RsbU (regulator of sigma subunit)